MERFEAPTRKQTIIYSPCLDALEEFEDWEKNTSTCKPKPQRLVRIKIVRGKKKVTGVEDRLKLSQEYTPYFGKMREVLKPLLLGKKKATPFNHAPEFNVKKKIKTYVDNSNISDQQAPANSSL